MNTFFNVGAKYSIIGRVTKGTSVIYYVMRDMENGRGFAMEKGMVEQLALNKQIYNCTGQIYGDLVNLKGINCKLSQLPKYTLDGQLVTDATNTKKKPTADLRLIGKVQSGRMITDYVVTAVNEPEKLMKIPRDTVIKLAQEGRLVNAKSQMNGADAMLRGANGFNLAELKLFK